MSDRTGRLVGDRPGPPVEPRNHEAQIRTLLDKQKEQILAEWQARKNQHEFQTARAKEDQQHLQEQLLQQNLELHQAHQESLTQMEELRKFQCSTFDTISRQKKSRIRTLYWNFLAECRIFKMKLYKRFKRVSGC